MSISNESYRKSYLKNNNFEDVEREYVIIYNKIQELREEGFTVKEAIKKLGYTTGAYKTAVKYAKNYYQKLQENKQSNEKILSKEEFRNFILSMKKS